MRPVSSLSVGDISRLFKAFQARAFVLALMGLTLTLSMGTAHEVKAQTPPQAAVQTPSGQPLPRWAMLRKQPVNARIGPSTDHPLLYTYTQSNLPVQIISETGKWRLVCDPDGNVAWIWSSLLTNARTVLSPAGSRIELRSRPSADAAVTAIMRPRALASVEKCSKGWCKVSVGGQKGWAPEDAFWGRQKTPVCQRPDPLGVR